MNKTSFTISLRIRHPSMSHEEIVKQLGMVPERAWSVGGARMTPVGEPLDGRYQKTYCTFMLIDRSDGWFTDGICRASSSLKAHRAFFHSIQDTGGSSELYVGVFVEGKSTGFTADVELMATLADLRLKMSVEIYCD